MCPYQDGPLHKPPSLHFRSTNSIDLLAYLTEKWKECLDSNTTLPASILHDYDLEKMRSSVVTSDESDEAEDIVLSVNILVDRTEEQQPTQEDINNEVEEQQPTQDVNNETEGQHTLGSSQPDVTRKNVLQTLIPLPITPSSSMVEFNSTCTCDTQ